MSQVTRPWVLRTLLAALFTATLSWATNVPGAIPWDPPAIAPLLQLFGTLMMLLVLLMIPAGGILALVSQKGRTQGVLAVAIGLSWIGGCEAKSLTHSYEHSLKRTVRQANRVVEAIERFKRDTGQPPISIAALMPRYLTTSDLPRRMTTLRYASATSPTQVWFAWTYELARASWPPDKSRARPSLSVEFSGRGTVRKLNTLFFDPPFFHAPSHFDSTLWARGDTLQLGMAVALSNSEMLLGRDTTEVARLLGSPTRRRQEYAGDWFLAVANTDLFGDYSALILDSPTEPSSDASNSIRIGRWWLCTGCYERLPDP